MTQHQQQHGMMRERHAYFSAMAGKYTDFEAFIKDNEHWLNIVGIELTASEQYLTLYIPLGFTDYEEYYIVNDDKGLTISPIVCFQDDYCANQLINIFTGEYANMEEIFSTV